jgi:hypothetical protein
MAASPLAGITVPPELEPSPGVLTSTESTIEKPDPTNQKLEDRLKNAIRSLARAADQRDSYSYMWAVNRALKARMYLRGNQHLIWDNDQKRYLVAPQVGSDTTSSDEPSSRQSFNIYLGYAKSFMATFAQNQAAVRMESSDPRNAVGIRGAEAAQKYIRIYDKFNPGKEQQVEIARFLWTDGKCVAYTREVYDGQKFGFEENSEVGEQPEGVNPQLGAQVLSGRVPRGREITSFLRDARDEVPGNGAAGKRLWIFQALAGTGHLADQERLSGCGEEPVGGEPGKLRFADGAQWAHRDGRGSRELRRGQPRVSADEGLLLVPAIMVRESE